MGLFKLPALFVAACTMMAAMDASAVEVSGNVYLEIMHTPPNRHVIAMNSMEECQRAAEYSNARCITKLPNLPDSSIGVLRSPKWSARTFYNDEVTTLDGKDFGPVYLVVRSTPPNRHTIAMGSMKECLEAIAYTSAKCLEKLPNLPDSSIGVLRVLDGPEF